jgi:hypothetical protein
MKGILRMIDNLFDVGVDNVHMVKVDSYEASAPITAPVLMATEKQLNFLKKLFIERSNNEEAQIVRGHLLTEYKAGKLTRKMASDAINDILMMEKDVKSPTTVEKSTELEHGQVWITREGQVVRIKMNQQGSAFYGLVWNGADWKYIPGILSTLDHTMTAEEAAKWGHEHQWCVFCSKNLSDPRSEAVGYGQTCANKRGLPWG